ncbi:MAG: right-handed parallel beta-helix repeat-containing protein [Thermoanaerobaculales bacterium]|nr:right-handed parallel beta-helix repeat-containing protein [Thermoanaerobaculales bacterium]
MMKIARSLPIFSGRLINVAIIGLLVTAAFAGPADAATYEVDRFDDDATATGCLVVPNDCSLRGAILKANTDGTSTTIVLPDGTYSLTIPGDNEDLGMTGDLDVLDGLIISAAPGTHPVIEQTATDRVFQTFWGTSTFSIIGPMTIRGGRVVHSPPDNGGGLILSYHSFLHVEDVIFEDGSSAGGGGCLSIAGVVNRSISLTNVTITGCSTAGYGGGVIAAIGDSPTTFDRLVVTNNTAEQPGGGVSILGSTTRIRFVDSTIEGNVSENSVTGDGYGGGIYLGSATALIENTTVAANRSGLATVGAGLGGGLYLSASDLTLRNSTISGNITEGSTSQGSAILLKSESGFSNLFIDQSTIAGEPVSSLVSSAVGIASNGAIIFEGSIVEGGCAIGVNGSFVSNGYNIERPLNGSVTTQCGLDNPSDVLTSNPFLLPLAGNGGPTQTHALMAGAPAIFLVSSGSCQATDQRSAPRAFLFCDAGSYESSGQPPGMWVFSDGFESGNTWAWSLTLP